MENARLDKMEEMLSKLISMVGNIHEQQNTMGARLDRMDERFDTMGARLDRMDARLDKMDARLDKMDERFDKMDARLDKIESDQSTMKKEILAKLTDIQADQDHIWEKAVKNEREIVKIKSRLQI